MWYYIITERETKKIKNKLEETKMMNRSDIESTAASLYDGGWTAEDRDKLISESELTEEDADAICEMLKSF